MRRVLPYSLLPLALVATVLASSPWLRAFPSDVIAVPLFGAALLSVITPTVVVGIGVRRLWLTAAVDLLMFVFYELFVTVRDPSGFDSLWDGLVHGPAQILSFALPLVSPRTLLVAPVALCWLAGAVVGECVARSWHSVVPYIVLVVAFGMSYAATTRAITSSADGRRYDTLLAAGLLLTMLLLRAAQTWLGQERGAAATQLDGRLPLRGLTIGIAVSLVVSLAAAGAVQSGAFDGRPRTPARVPPLNQSAPLTPISFVSGLRPSDPRAAGRALFDVTFNRATSNYVSIASVDDYDGSGWSFDRTFRPSGGVVPAEDDPGLRPATRPVTQVYSIDAGPMTTAPWMPYLHRVSKVSGTAINIDAASGMIVPARRLTAGTTYTVESATSQALFSDLPANAVPSLSGSASDMQLPGAVTDQLSSLITTLRGEIPGASDLQPIPFLQAVAGYFQDNDALSGGPNTVGATPVPASSGSPGRPASGQADPSAAAPTGRSVAGGTGFADVLASIRQNRSATPEQYATLTALIARKLNVQARLVAGFRLTSPGGSATLPAGRYTVTTAEAWTWVEVPVDGVGWVVLDPSPGTYSGKDPRSASAQPTGPASATPTQSVAISRPADSDVGRGEAAPGDVSGSRDLSTVGVAVIVTAVTIAVLLALLILLVLRKRLRTRRRRSAGDPRAAVIGAWQETLDVLVESGLPGLDHLTGDEVVVLTVARFGPGAAASIEAIARSANIAIFGPASWLDAADAERAWQSHVELRRTVRRGLSWPARVRASLRYNRRRRGGAPAGPPSWLVSSHTGLDDAGGRGLRLRTPARRAR